MTGQKDHSAAVTAKQNDQQIANILIVDDEESIRLALKAALSIHYNVETTSRGEVALSKIRETQVDLVLLDIHLPGMDGIETLAAMREEAPHIAVIMLTAYSTVENAISALRKGAVDYLRKPASTEEILESVRRGLLEAQREHHHWAVIRKARNIMRSSLQELESIIPDSEDIPEHVLALAESLNTVLQETEDPDRYLRRGELTIDLYRRVATLAGETLDLTAGEYDLLICLVQEAPRVLDPQELVRRTRGFECDLQEAREIIRWQVYLLRQKIESDSSNPTYILNVRGRGYVWADA